MDPVSITGLIGAVVGIADVVTRSIRRLSSASCILLQTALDQLSEWIEKGLGRDPRFDQLADRVGNALACFEPLMLSLQARLDHLETEEIKEQKEVSFGKRVAFVWNEAELAEYFTLLDRQVNALTLLLEAIQCKTWIEQNELLGQERNQIVFQLAQDCSSSIAGLRTSVAEARSSHFSEDTHAVSMAFDFDAVFLASKTYQTAHRSHLKQLLNSREKSKRTSIPQSGRMDTRKAIVSEPSSNILPLIQSIEDLWLFETKDELGGQCKPYRNGPAWWLGMDYRICVGEAVTINPGVSPRNALIQEGHFNKLAGIDDVPKVALLGDEQSGKTTLMKALACSQNDPIEAIYSQKARQNWNRNIFDWLEHYMIQLLSDMEVMGFMLANAQNESHGRMVLSRPIGSRRSLPSQLAVAIQALMADPGVQLCLDTRRKTEASHNVRYFANQVHRLTDEDFLATNEDILKAYVPSSNVTALLFKSMEASHVIWDVGDMRSADKESIAHCLTGATKIIFTINSIAYNRYSAGDQYLSGWNKLEDQFALFRKTLHAHKDYLPSISLIVLIFTRKDEIEEELIRSPPQRRYPDCPADSQGQTLPSDYFHWLRNRFFDLVPNTFMGVINTIQANLVDPEVPIAREMDRVLQGPWSSDAYFFR